jgi:elongation factor P
MSVSIQRLIYLSVDMPASVILEVTYADQIKGNTATNATKSATVETGATVNVPLFINEGDKIKIDTASGSTWSVKE